MPYMPFITRFKDGHIIRSDVVGGSGNSGSVYEVASVKADDVGHYVCRAISLGGKNFSRVASLVVKALRFRQRARSPLMAPRSVRSTCVTRTSSDSEGLCCVPSSMRQLQVECDGFSYEVNQVASCECARCDDNKKVTVTGRASSGGADVTDVHVLYDDVTYDVTKSQFLFEATPQAGAIVFQVKSSSFMPRLVTLDVNDGVAQVYVEVSLVVRPSPDVVDAATGAQLQVVTPGMSSAVSVTIPPGAFHDKNGDPVSGNVNDSEGGTRLLKTFGVVTLLAEDTNGNDVYLSGKATMTLNTDAMGLTVGESVSLWVIDGASGTWRKTVDMMTGSRRRRRRQASIGSTLTGQTAMPTNFPFVNCDFPLPRRLYCSVAVYVYLGSDFSVPMSGERVTAFTFDKGQLNSRATATTDMNCRACLSVVCGLRLIVRKVSRGGTLVHPTHSLPDGFPFTNVVNGVEFTATPPDSEAEQTNGSVFLLQGLTDGCRADVSSPFFFRLAVAPIRPSLYGSLNADRGWSPTRRRHPPRAPSSSYSTYTNVASKIKVVGLSSDPQGVPYGTFTAPLVESDGQLGFTTHQACVLARCPTAAANYTRVEIQIAYEKRLQCPLGKMRYV
ncbi:hypothetical protein NP493_652g03046 [Ridgeia piscesae]|uniref:Uncharacterized protein n=1 Tax=Ridgeia piscesae TaxID=27915 RepID=A0AAD9KSC0_RIDPI|nr:hypothetical protein NP493_652g03046 [Ridgeia piscesae]